ncbi:carboxypeptidase-like regulatory domain-containing protein [Marivirga sp.]|uniref:carboxypeptidase-like regulatory domain-containing protein n=1 Tax=Marivirga sp. TaxID=2018662 RepID=UPI003DA75C6B
MIDKRILLIVLFFLSFSSHSQNLFEGEILDESTGEPIQSAVIIIQGSTVGTTSSSDGTFKLESDKRKITVVTTHMSYEKNVTTILSRKNPHTIELNETIYQLNEVNVGIGEYDGPSELQKFDSAEYYSELLDGLESNENPGFTLVEKSFNFFGGMENLKAYFAANFRYPAKVQEKDLSGIVYVLFTITEEGTANDIEFMKPDGQINEAVKNELIRLINLMPKWYPAFQRGEPVPVRVVIPFSYAANGNGAKN